MTLDVSETYVAQLKPGSFFGNVFFKKRLQLDTLISESFISRLPFNYTSRLSTIGCFEPIDRFKREVAVAIVTKEK